MEMYCTQEPISLLLANREGLFYPLPFPARRRRFCNEDLESAYVTPPSPTAPFSRIPERLVFRSLLLSAAETP